MDNKEFYHHSGYPDGLKKESLRHYYEEKPDELIKRSVWGMLPKNKLGKAMLKKLKVYTGGVHPHYSQMPKALEIKE